MAANTTPRDAAIYLLGDHLDAALAMGEDLLTEKVTLADPVRKLTMARHSRQTREVKDFLSTVHTLELSLTSRLMQARRRAEELKRRETRLKPLITLYLAGTVPLADAAAELGDTIARDFETGDAPLAFLRGRGLIAPDAAGFEGLAQLAVTEDYLVAGRIRLGIVLDLVATFLDTLDLLFELYTEPATAEDSTSSLSIAPDAPAAGSTRAT